MHLFDGYWEDIGTIKSFYQCNLDLAKSPPSFEMASADAPIYTRARFLPPARIDNAVIKNSLISDGCIIESGAVIENSVIGVRTVIGKNVTIKDSVLMGVDDYETESQCDTANATGQPLLGIGDGSVIEILRFTLSYSNVVTQPSSLVADTNLPASSYVHDLVSVLLRVSDSSRDRSSYANVTKLSFGSEKMVLRPSVS